MDHKWTPRSSRPSALYRVQHPESHTKSSAREGLVSSALDANELQFIPSTELSAFIKSIKSHRNQCHSPSPYISLFADKAEAESWAIAAEDIFGKEAYVVEINVKHSLMQKATMWFVQDIQDKTSDWQGIGPLTEFRNSEWLVLGEIPPQAVKTPFRGSKAIRAQREWQNDNLDAAYVPSPLPDQELVDCATAKQLEWIVGDDCGCPNPFDCPHSTPFQAQVEKEYDRLMGVYGA